MAQLPHIAMLCHEDKNRLQSIVLDHLLPLVVKCLADNDNLVRKERFLLYLSCQSSMDKSFARTEQFTGTFRHKICSSFTEPQCLK